MTLNLQNKTPKERRQLIENKVRREACESAGFTWLCLVGFSVFAIAFIFALVVGDFIVLIISAALIAAVFGPQYYSQQIITKKTLQQFRDKGRPFCMNCYYDLHDLDDHSRCPECGSESHWREWDIELDIDPQHRPR